MIDKYEIHKVKKKLNDNIGNFYVVDDGHVINYLKSFSCYNQAEAFGMVFYIHLVYCQFKDETPYTFLEEHVESLNSEKIEEIEFLTVEELFKRYRTKVINLYRMISKFPENDIYHRDKKLPFIREFSKIDDEEMNDITIEIETKKYNL